MCENVLPSLQELVVGASRVHGHSRVNDNKTINNCYSFFHDCYVLFDVAGAFSALHAHAWTDLEKQEHGVLELSRGSFNDFIIIIARMDWMTSQQEGRHRTETEITGCCSWLTARQTTRDVCITCRSLVKVSRWGDRGRMCGGQRRWRGAQGAHCYRNARWANLQASRWDDLTSRRVVENDMSRVDR